MYHDVYCLCLFTVFYDYFTSSIDGIQGRVMALNATFNTIQLYRGGQLYWSVWLTIHLFLMSFTSLM
jgi:hypothetical protein